MSSLEHVITPGGSTPTRRDEIDGAPPTELSADVPIKRGSRPRASCADGLPGPRSGPGRSRGVASVILDGMSAASEGHWERVYETRSTDEVSWFQAEPSVSRRLVEAAVGTQGSVVDVGAGASRLVDLLLDDGFSDLTVLDVSARALAVVRQRLGQRSTEVTWVRGDVLDWHPGRSFDVWHDRPSSTSSPTPRTDRGTSNWWNGSYTQAAR